MKNAVSNTAVIALIANAILGGPTLVSILIAAPLTLLLVTETRRNVATWRGLNR